MASLIRKGSIDIRGVTLSLRAYRRDDGRQTITVMGCTLPAVSSELEGSVNVREIFQEELARVRRRRQG